MRPVEFSILAPDLDAPSHKMLRILVDKSAMDMAEVASTLANCHTRHVLSVGKAALDTWHDYGLIGVVAHHGNLFRHWDSLIGHRVIMPVHHPAVVFQQRFGGWEVKDQMLFDLARWRGVVTGETGYEELKQQSCGRCATRRRNSTRRPAEHWVAELDGCGLCEDCYRGRSKITKKAKSVKPKPGSKAAQLPGQLEMIPDGRQILIPKR